MSGTLRGLRIRNDIAIKSQFVELLLSSGRLAESAAAQDMLLLGSAILMLHCQSELVSEATKLVAAGQHHRKQITGTALTGCSLCAAGPECCLPQRLQL